MHFVISVRSHKLFGATLRRAFLAYVIAGIAGESVGDWAACRICHALIQAGNRSELADRSVRTLIEKHPEMRGVEAELREQIAHFQRHVLPEPRGKCDAGRVAKSRRPVVRTQARLKLGYYPLAVAEARRIRAFLHFSAETASVLDPCAGTGAALCTVSDGATVRRYGVELDAYRAGEARKILDEVIQGSAFDTHAAVDSFSLVYLNPPYEVETGEGKNQRMERLFLEHVGRWSAAWRRACDGRPLRSNLRV